LAADRSKPPTYINQQTERYSAFLVEEGVGIIDLMHLDIAEDADNRGAIAATTRKQPINLVSIFRSCNIRPPLAEYFR
jgi:maleate cis-trans isomerase